MFIYRIILAVAALTLGAAAVLALPGFSPEVEASAPAALQKSDRLDIRPIGRDCSQQGWPYYETNCLRDRTNATGKASTVRVIKIEKVAGK